ncbi:MAG: cobalamin-dependent protein [Nanoarchaeota archaeon]|nr:cobalamin-dependent protein [Nanoarchaeota archaeon]
MINISTGKKKNIMFIKPPLVTDAVWDPIRTCPYLGIVYLASGLKDKGHNVRYLDEVVRNGGLYNQTLSKRVLDKESVSEKDLDIKNQDFQKEKMSDYWSLSPKEFVDKYTAFPEKAIVSRTLVRTGTSLENTLSEIEKENPDIIGIPLIATANYIPATSLARSIKENFPKIKIIFGGQHISALPEQFFTENKDYVDHIVIGDAVSVIEDIVEGRIGDRIINGGSQSLANFPLLDPKILEKNDYPIIPTYTPPTNGRKTIDFMFTKGCFRDCAFCLAGNGVGDRVTASEYQRLDEQLRIFKEAGIEEIVVQDDAFLWKPKTHLPEILRLMKNYGFYWQDNGGVEFESLSDDVAEQFIEYNKNGEGRVTALYIPFNPRNWNKDSSASASMSNKYKSRLDNLKKLREEAGIYIFTSAIIGTPEQTKKTFEEELSTDRKLIQEGYLDAALCLSATMLPGTEWYKTNGHNIVNPIDYYGFSLFTTHDRTEHLEPKEIEEFMIRWTKELADVQTTYHWGTAFPNPKLQKVRKGN